MGRRAFSTSAAGVLVVTVVVLAAIWRTWDTGVNGDVMYVLGGLRAAGDAGQRFGEIFVARPFAYKCWIAALDAVRKLFVSDPVTIAGMGVVRLGADVVVLGVCAVLHRGLRRHVGGFPAACAAVSLAVGLIMSPRFNFLEPDWTAALTAVLAGGLLLCFRSERLARTLGGIALWLTVAMKVSTAVFACIAVLLVFQLSRRRAVGGAVVGLIITAAWYLLSHVLQPIEWRWFADQAALVHDSPIHHAPRLADAQDLAGAVLNAGVMSPVVVGAVGAAALFVLRGVDRAQRRYRLVVVLLCVALAVASGFAQGEWFLYHFSDLAILSALAWGLAVAVADRFERWALLVGTLIPAVVGAAVIPSYGGEPARQALLVGVTVAAAAAVVLLLGSHARHREPERSAAPPAGRVGLVILAAAVVVAFVASATTAAVSSPMSIVGYDVRTASRPNAQQAEDALRTQYRAGERLGARTPVLYLTYGATLFAFPNPAPCNYPSPQWLQRTARQPYVQTYWSYRDNLKCLSDPRPKFVIIDPRWFPLAHLPRQVQTLVAANFDCSAPVLPAPPGLQICPRRR